MIQAKERHKKAFKFSQYLKIFLIFANEIANFYYKTEKAINRPFQSVFLCLAFSKTPFRKYNYAHFLLNGMTSICHQIEVIVTKLYVT